MTAKTLRDELKTYVESAYLHGLPVENLDTGELEPPSDIADTAWIVDKLVSIFTILCTEVINSIEQSLDSHTTPEGKDLLTRSYIKNTLEFERQRLQKLIK